MSGKLLTDVKGHTAWVNSAVFSSDGSKILTASLDKTAKLWDLNGKLLADLRSHTDWVNSAVFSPDGKRIVTASNDCTVIIWPTPELIMEWLKTAPIPKLTQKEKEELGIAGFKID
jgi:WD40 repeat protein